MSAKNLTSAAVAGAFLLLLMIGGRAVSAAEHLTLDAVNKATLETPATAGKPNPLILKIQILLDRAHFSPGVIDGYAGENVTKALKAFQQAHNLQVTGKPDGPTWKKLTAASEGAVVRRYTITKKDIDGPFVKKIPSDYGEMAKLKRLSYTGVAEMLAERFHMDIDLLKALNPKASFDKAGAKIIVAEPGKGRAKVRVTKIKINRAAGSATAFDEDGNIVAFYPATVGSRQLPSPNGVHKVTAVAIMPTYTYRPDVNFKQGNNDKPLTIPPGPNGPVGSVWIDLSKPTYGIHGTPRPSKIDKDNSHGCVRLTNWDATELAHLVKKGTIVEFVQ